MTCTICHEECETAALTIRTDDNNEDVCIPCFRVWDQVNQILKHVFVTLPELREDQPPPPPSRIARP